MLNPRDRQLLLECLRPPSGYRLDRAVGTTYSLDLIALLTAPLAFTLFDWEDEQGRPTSDPVALLEAVRRHAGHIHLFCEAGQIKVPPPGQRLVAWLEQSIIQVQAPNDQGVFHPKIWLLRFVCEDQPTRYRFLCSSRNMTFDRSWDCMLSLDGVLADRQLSIGASRPLGEFIAALPGLALQPMTEGSRAAILGMAQEVKKVRFELPEGVEEFALFPMGLNGTKAPEFNGSSKPILIVSPFLTSSFLEQATGSCSKAILVSRPDQLANLPAETLAKFAEVYALDPTAEDIGDPDEQTEHSLAGLHAKIFVEDDGWNARVLIGSANATSAAFERNVEFLTELTGKKSKLGIASFLDGKGAFKELLSPWEGLAFEKDAESQAREVLREALERVKRALATAGFSVRVEGRQDGLYDLVLRLSAALESPADVTVSCWPASIPKDHMTPLAWGSTGEQRFGPVTPDAITAFFAFEISAQSEGFREATRFVLSLPMEGAPEDRFDRIMASVLKDKDRLLRLLWLLLQGDSSSAIGSFVKVGSGFFGAFSGANGYPVFEHLVRALATAPDRLRDAGQLIERLAQMEEGRAVMPEGLYELWKSLDSCLERRK